MEKFKNYTPTMIYSKNGQKRLNKIEKWLLSTSVNIIYRRTSLLLDENLGLGATYGSCEDIDYAIRQYSQAYYTPNLIVRHPFQSSSTNTNSKIYNYALGFGALCKKHLSFTSIFLLLASICYTIIKFVFKRLNYKQAKNSILGKLNGFIAYKC